MQKIIHAKDITCKTYYMQMILHAEILHAKDITCERHYMQKILHAKVHAIIYFVYFVCKMCVCVCVCMCRR